MADPKALAQEALDPKKEADVAKAVAQLTPEQALHFLELLERQIKQRRIQLIGYLTAMFIMLVGTVIALVVIGRAEPGTFMGWVFFIPLLAVALVLLIFGRWANRIK